jgi:uncharacterized protein YecE (DUF72 family)
VPPARIGTVDLPARVDIERYFGELDYLEFSGLFAGPLKPSAIARVAQLAPENALGLCAPYSLTHRHPPTGNKLWPHDASTGDFRDSATSRACVPIVNDTADQLHARAIVFRAPDSFSPSAANRDQLRRFFSEVASRDALGGRPRVWVPGGLWEVMPAVKLANELDVICGFDPLVREPGQPPEIYYHLEATSLYFRIESGRSGPLRGERLADLALLIEHYGHDTDVTLAFATAERWHDAKNLKKLLASAS